MKRGLDEYQEPAQAPAAPETGKRSRVYGEVPLKEVTMTVRVLLAVRDSGLIIGKQGANIKKVREASGAEVRLADAPPNSSRRAASVSGSPDQVSAALREIVDVLHGAENAVDPVALTITLLVGNEVVGACIGKGGNVISQTRESTGAEIKISDRPIEGSTEKTVELRGTKGACASACDMIVRQVATMAEKPSGAVPVTKVEWGSPAALSALHAAPVDEYTRSGYGGGYGNYGPPPTGGEKRQVVIPVATALAGSLIGKGGHVIRRIRETSGAEVKIQDPTGGDTRNVTITGNEFTTHQAVEMVYSALGQPSPYGPSVPAPPPPAVAPQYYGGGSSGSYGEGYGNYGGSYGDGSGYGGRYY